VQIRTLLFCNGGIERKQNRGGGVDRHRRRDTVQRDALEQRFHVFERINRHARFSHFSGGTRMIRVVSNLRRQIERHRQTCLAFREQVPEPLVRLRRRSKTRVLAHGPKTPAIHGRVNAAGVGKLSGNTNRAGRVLFAEIVLCVDRFQGNAAEGSEMLLTLALRGRFFGGLIGQRFHRTRRESRNESMPNRIMRSA